jgi:hypothetical protein
MKPIGTRRSAMRGVVGALIATALFLGAPPAPVEAPSIAAPSLSTISPLPPRAPLNQIAPPSVTERQIGAAPNRGAVTGYGAAGMGRVPGSPPNPPYR